MCTKGFVKECALIKRKVAAASQSNIETDELKLGRSFSLQRNQVSVNFRITEQGC